MMLSLHHCQQARLSRDHRFDGLFFIAVKTTGIYCRPVCPAPSPKEQNVSYYETAIAAANAGYRPCLRCRPDSAPGSPAWQGKNTTLQRALSLIDEGALQHGTITALSDRLGITDRYLRQLFEAELGLAPKPYALYQQCLFAKKLLHETSLAITDIALASGFNSVRRFNDCFKRQFRLTPREVRKKVRKNVRVKQRNIRLFLSFRPPYNWPFLQDFLACRRIEGLEWVDANSYGRSFRIGASKGQFTAHFDGSRNGFEVELQIDDLRQLPQAARNIRRLLDLDADIRVIEDSLGKALGGHKLKHSGLRLPGIWSPYEAGVRAILGQQVSVAAARNLVQNVVAHFNRHFNKENRDDIFYFPTPGDILNSDLAFIKMPGARKTALKNFAAFATEQDLNDSADDLIQLKGIGPWTIDYIKMRGLSHPDIFLANDLGVKKAVALLGRQFEPKAAEPWRSYLTFHLWSML